MQPLNEILQSLRRFGRQKTHSQRARKELTLQYADLYAVGDVHGCYEQLLSLERKIAEDAAHSGGTKLLVMLGDYIDRGPDSARVVDHLLKPPPEGFERICLAGNHETAFLDYLDGKLDRDLWLSGGGGPTLLSYGLDLAYLAGLYNSGEIDRLVRATVPPEHVEFLRSLPVMAYSPQVAFVHAGIRPGIPLEAQDEQDLLYIRGAFFEGEARLDRWVIHGHTPVKAPQLRGRRLNIDTGAYQTGLLTAVRIGSRGARFLSS